MAEQTPARKAVHNIISTLVANTVNIQEAEKGRLTTNKEFLLPHLNTTELRSPPSRAPRSDKLANQEVCWWVIGITDDDNGDDGWVKLAKAGEEYPLLRPTAKGPNDTASTVSTWAVVCRFSQTR